MTFIPSRLQGWPTTRVRRSPLNLLLAGLMLGLMLGACGRFADVKSDGRASSPARVQRYDEAVRIALADREAYPEDLEVGRNLVRALLNAREFAVAYEEAQHLREQAPSDAESLVLLGHACFGLGLFDEAAACFNASLKIAPSTEATWWLGYILVARGNEEEARQVLRAGLDPSDPDWGICHLLLEVTPSREGKLTLLEAYRTRYPGNEEAAMTELAVRNNVEQARYGRMLSRRGAIIRARLTDYYNVSLRVNGFKVLARFAMGRSGLLISEAAVTGLELRETGERGPMVRGVGGNGVADSKIVMIERLELGDLVLEDVQAQMVDNLHTPDVVAVFGSDLLPGYSYRLDRKNEMLTMYPPELDVPSPAESAWVQRYYKMDHLILTEAFIKNRATDKAVKAMVALSSETRDTLLNLDYAHALDLGLLNTTVPVQDKGLTGYFRKVLVGFTEIDFAGVRFISGGARDPYADGSMPLAQDGFFAAELTNLGTFVPYAQLGRDILRRCMLTVDKRNHQLILDVYES